MANETRTVTIADRDIEVIELTETQFALMGREMSRLERVMRKENVNSEDIRPTLDGMGRVLDIIETRVISQEDRDFLVDLMAKGDLNVQDILPILTAFADDAIPRKAAVSRARTNRKR